MNASLTLFGTPSLSKSAAILGAARALQPALMRSKSLDRALVRDCMSFSFMGSDHEGVWNWKDAYEAIEAAQVLYARKFSAQIAQLEAAPMDVLDFLIKLSALSLTHSRRSEEQIALDQFSTPAELAALAVLAAQVRVGDLVLEPSAGTGLIAIVAEACGAKLYLNELAQTRSQLLEGLFINATHSQFDATTLHDRIDRAGQFDVVLMNPPFKNIEAHLASAAKCVCDGGRVCAIVPTSLFDSSLMAKLLAHFVVRARIIFPQNAFSKHGTSVETGLLVFDRVTPEGASAPIIASESLQGALEAVLSIPARIAAKPRIFRSAAPISPLLKPSISRSVASTRFSFLNSTSLLTYEPVEWTGMGEDVGLFSAYQVSRMAFLPSYPHPSSLVESSAMGSVSVPLPTYRPKLPPNVLSGGLSDAQLETVVYAGQAHSEILPGLWALNETKSNYMAVSADHEGAFHLRKGFFLGDGTGVGKGRQISAVIADNIANGRAKALWISKNDELLEDAQRDWSAIGGVASDIVCQSSYKLGQPIRMDKGILFSTYATLRVGARQEKKSRLDQIVDWLGADFDGAIIFDEAHEMANAAGGKGNRGAKKPSQQGLAGLMLQYRLPNARIMYVSATGATTPENLAYACRLGLWGSTEAPFLTREDFLKAADDGGVAVMELIARELKAQGLYVARMLSFDGLTIEPLVHQLTPSNVEIWDAWAEAFEIIHTNLDKALEAIGAVDGEGKTASGQARGAAKSAFASTSQRFFNALLCGFKTPTLIQAIEQDVKSGFACVIQLVSTNQAVMDRRLEAISPAQWNDLHIDLTPRDAVTEYLQNSFPTTCFVETEDENGNLKLVPLIDKDGNCVHSQEALALRDELILALATLPAVPGVLDGLVHHFGPDRIAEITGRNRRVILKEGRLMLDKRSASAAKAETDDFMGGRKDILVFSQAGGTGRSYHADRSCLNQKPRRHYLVESGWRADAAIQGIGRTHRSNQVCAPCFRPVTTSIKGEKRFLSTIARRLHSLGALSTGERRGAGNGLFRPEDNLENDFARRALQAFYHALFQGKIDCLSITEFERKTALRLRDAAGCLLSNEDLPALHTFLNRLLALRIGDQSAVFEAFEGRLKAILEKAEAAGALDKGVEDLTPDEVDLMSDQVIRTDATGAQTRLLRFSVKVRRKIKSLGDLQCIFENWPRSAYDYVYNSKSQRVALLERGVTTTDDNDGLVTAVRLHRPTKQDVLREDQYSESNWQVIDAADWQRLWNEEVEKLDPYTHTHLNLVTGLLLPIWKHLPSKSCYVKRLRAPNGKRWLGRTLSDAEAMKLMQVLGVSDSKPEIASPELAHDLVMRDQGLIRLVSHLSLKRSKVMDKHRLEVFGNSAEYRRLRELGCFVEIINHTARIFLPVGDMAVMGAVLKSYPAQDLVLPS